MAKRKIVEKDGVSYVVIPLTKKVLIEGKIVEKGTNLLVEEDGVVDTIQTDADIADAGAGDFDELYDRASMRRMRYAMDADDVIGGLAGDETPITMTMEDVLTPEERVEMRRRMARMEKEGEDKSEMRSRLQRMSRMAKDEKDKDKMDKEEEKDKMEKDKEDKEKMSRMFRMRRMDKEEDKDKMDKDEEEKKEMRRARMLARMRRMDKDEEEKDKMDKEDKKDKDE